jgi:hypothetical protein
LELGGWQVERCSGIARELRVQQSRLAIVRAFKNRGRRTNFAVQHLAGRWSSYLYGMRGSALGFKDINNFGFVVQWLKKRHFLERIVRGICKVSAKAKGLRAAILAPTKHLREGELCYGMRNG